MYRVERQLTREEKRLAQRRLADLTTAVIILLLLVMWLAAWMLL